MAAVTPVVENREQRRPADTTPLRAAEFDTGQTIGREIARLGQTGQDAAETQNRVEITYSEIAARDADNQATLARQRLYHDGDSAFFNLRGRNALLAREQVQTERERIDREAMESLRGDSLAQDMYRQRSAMRGAADNERIARHVTTEGNRYADSVDEDGLRVTADAARNAQDNPEELQRLIATAREIAGRNAIRNGIAAEGSPELDNRQRRAAGVVVAAAADAIERRSPLEAMAFVQTMREQIDGETFVRLTDALEETAAVEEADENVVEDLVYAGGEAPPAAEGDAPTPAAGAATASGADRVMNYEARDSGIPVVPASVQTLGQARAFALTVNAANRRRMGRVGSSAMGTYQITGDTIEEFAPRVFGANWRNQPFTAATQERLAEAIFNSARGSAAALKGRWASLTLAEAERVRRMPWAQARIEIARGESGGSPGPRTREEIVASGIEIDMPATIERINARTDLTYPQKQARIAAATRRHSADRQARAEVEDDVQDQAAAAMNALGDGYTNYNQLPLSIRQRASRFPRIEAQLRGAAATNLNARNSSAEEAARENPAYLDLLELANGNDGEVNAFLRQDIRTLPGITYQQRASLIDRQGSIQRQRQPTAAATRVRITDVRSVVDTVVGRPEAQIGAPGATRTQEQRANRLLLEERVRVRVEAEQTRLGARLNREQILEIVESEIQPVRTVRSGRLYGETTETGPAYRSRTEATEEQPDRYVRTEFDLPDGVPAAAGGQIVEAWRRTHNGGYPTHDQILRIYQARR